MTGEFNLNGIWELSSSSWDIRSLPAKVPGDNYSALFEAGIISDPYYGRNEEEVQKYRDMEWTFSREFQVEKELLDYHLIFLETAMVDTFAELWINGEKVMSLSNMFVRKKVNVKPYLKLGSNRIEFRFAPATKEAAKVAERLPFPVPMTVSPKVDHLNLIRKVHCHGGWDWGITLMVCGIYEDLKLTGVNCVQIESVNIRQEHHPDYVRVLTQLELLAVNAINIDIKFNFNAEEQVINVNLNSGLQTIEACFIVRNPHLWWPNGSGEPYLYPMTIETPDEIKQLEIGLRTIEVVNIPDEKGLGMLFRVNGVDIFCKGASWIPCDAMPLRQTAEVYEQLIDSAAEANMNMLRVWGGGQYEHEIFYRLCDRKGIMVWQDMMFACSVYPSTPEFISSVMEELDSQIRRLRVHPCVAIWCGDNEILGGLRRYEGDTYLRYLLNYDRLNNAIGEKVRSLDPDRTFWPSSPCGGPGNFNYNWIDDTSGDMHYWEVWHGGKDFTAYLKKRPRFCSEFGFQSFPSFETVAGCCPPEQFNVFSPVMDHHQKCPRGNAAMIGMFGNYFRMPESFRDFLYLSQVQQAVAIKTGVEFWRTLKPHCMGTLYWQLNDNWPVASWSSIEYGGKWKQLHYHAKRFFSPVIAVLLEDVDSLKLHVVSDLRHNANVCLSLSRFDFSGKLLGCEELILELMPNESRLAKNVPPENGFYILSLKAEANGKIYHHENTMFPVPYKQCNLLPADIAVKFLEDLNALELTTDYPAFFVTLDAPGSHGHFSDNSFTLLPGQPKTVMFHGKNTVNEIKDILEINHLRNTYK